MEDNSCLALDLMLKDLVESREVTQISDKNWDTLSRLIPGTTPRQCSRRYDELCKQAANENIFSNGSSLRLQSNKMNGKTDTDETKISSSRPSSAKFKGLLKLDKQKSAESDSKDPADHGPKMTIHVCDEAKNLKQDFYCPRDLLVKEMKYFAEYLSTDAQRWEEVDISVHCDVQIFDWLMKYVKRYTAEVDNPPKLADLKPNNVISILISSDFLKMDSLVKECIEYCHGNVSAIVATPCNMNCINDALVSRISDLFTHNEVEDIRDRKDKFKSKLYAKKLEKLFDPEPTSLCSPENAASLFRCSECKKILTLPLEKKIKCSVTRMTIDRLGNLTFSHIKDPTFNVSDYLLSLKAELKSWREVYWRIWGLVNYLTCARCSDVFPCTELGQCRYHPERANFETKISESPVVTVTASGVYPCCNKESLRFDPTKQNNGCKLRDHIVNVKDMKKFEDEDFSDPLSRVYDDLLSHRDLICIAIKNTFASEELTDEFVEVVEQISAQHIPFSVFDNEDTLLSCKKQDSIPSSKVLHEMGKTESWPAPRLEALMVEKEIPFEDLEQYNESDDEVGDDETPRGRKPRYTRKVTVDPQAILVDAPDFTTTKSRKWDGNKSLRWNQDAQREEDRRRMSDIVNYLTRLRLNADKLERKQKEYAGGIYSKLEAQWKASTLPATKGLKEPIRGKQKFPGVRQTTLSA